MFCFNVVLFSGVFIKFRKEPTLEKSFGKVCCVLKIANMKKRMFEVGLLKYEKRNKD